jgi:thiamine-phosphate pyrophosphorylase
MITDGQVAAGRDGAALVERVRTAARAGVHLIQLRERGLDDRELADLARQCVEAVRGTRTRLVVNDRLDVARAAGAHGVHLRSDSFPAMRMRSLVPPGFLVGRSIHSVKEATRAGEENAVDYLIFGTVFATASKPDREPVGVNTLAAAVHSTAVPLLAVGGVTTENVPLIAKTGAAGVAAIGLFVDRSAIARAVEDIARAFDTPVTGS